MTVNRVSQSGVEVLLEELAVSRVTLSGVEVLIKTLGPTIVTTVSSDVIYKGILADVAQDPVVIVTSISSINYEALQSDIFSGNLLTTLPTNITYIGVEFEIIQLNPRASRFLMYF